jgi:hypothetical protein
MIHCPIRMSSTKWDCSSAGVAPPQGDHKENGDDSASPLRSPANRTFGRSRIGTYAISALIKHVDYFRCAIRPRQAHFRMFSSRKANPVGLLNVHAEIEEVVPVVRRVADGRIDF